jgi:hypothetical protein
MKKAIFWASALSLSASSVVGCASDDASISPEAGKDGTVDASASDVASDVASDTLADTADAADADAQAVPQRVLVTVSSTEKSELFAVNVATGTIDGTLTFPGFGTTDAQNTLFPFVLEQSNNVVARLDSSRPWVVDSSWNILNDAPDGGLSYTNPYAVVIGAGTKAYVLSYNRNDIAVIDTSQKVDGGPPTKTVDLSNLLQAGGDSTVEMTEGIFVPPSTLYVVLGNINQNSVAPPNFELLCTGTTSTVIAIDTTTDALIQLADGGPGGAIALQGFDPVPDGLVFDSANNRLLILEAGCNPSVDGGAGPITRRGVEAVDLTDRTTSVLLDASAAFPDNGGFPDGFVYVDGRHAVLGLGSGVYHWDPTNTKVGALIPNAPSPFTYDGNGNLLGTVTTETDAGSSTKVVSVNLSTGNSTTLNDSQKLSEISNGFIGGVDVWPHP